MTRKKNSQGVVAYHNDMNLVNFAGFKEKELDLFFSICHEMKEKGSNEINFSFSKIRELSSYSNRNLSRLYNDLDKVYKKMLELNLKYEDEKMIKRFTLFNKYIIKKEEQEILIKANEEFEYILNNFVGCFTLLELRTFVNLESKYSKNLYRLLCGNNGKRKAEFTIEEFRNILNIPQNYRLSEIDKYIFAPALKELPKIFHNLKLEKIKKGNKVTSIIFTWSREQENIIEGELIEITISETLNNAIEKAKKNRFIKNLLILDNIEILLKTFAENDLVKGLNYAYKEVRQDISSLNYLIKTIRTGIEKKEKQLVIKKTEEKIDTFDKYFEEIPLNFDKKELEKITRLDYEKLYQEYLKKHNISNLKTVRKGFDISNKNRYKIIEERQTQEEEKDKALKNDFTDSKTEIDLIIEKYNIDETMIKTGMKMGFSKEETVKLLEANYKEQEQEHKEFLIEKNIYQIEDISKDKLLSKTGKKLVGGALISRLIKLAKEEEIKIEYNGKIY